MPRVPEEGTCEINCPGDTNPDPTENVAPIMYVVAPQIRIEKRNGPTIGKIDRLPRLPTLTAPRSMPNAQLAPDVQLAGRVGRLACDDLGL